MKQLILSSLLFLSSISAMSAYVPIKLADYVYEPQIKTVRLTQAKDINDVLTVITLNSGNQLHLQFDELKGTNEFYNYTFIHCDANWQVSNLQQPEYLEGNTMGNIDNFNYSNNTYQTYVQYSLNFPNEEMNVTKSGNYILKVFRNFDEEDLVITRRFMILSPKTMISASAKAATDVKYRFRKQEVDFTISHEEYIIPNPFQDAQAVILQNNNWMNAKFGIRPQFSANNVLTFNYEDVNTFDGINEFRFFDTRTLRSFSNNVVDKYKDSLNNVVLRPEEFRGHLSYVYWLDFNGKMVVNNRDGSEAALDDDYLMAHFFLKSDHVLKGGDVYLYGQVTDWRIQEEFKLKYMPDYKGYYNLSKVKQGYINYLYVQKDANGNLDFLQTEGNHFETTNDYTILFYHKNQVLGYDELVGFVQIESSR